MNKIIIGMLVVFSGMYSCRKPIEACIQIDNVTPKLGEEITVVNCTKKFDFFEIDMGDGKLFDDNNGILNHAYDKSGTYRVTISATDERGRDSDETSENIIVPPPNASEFEGFWRFYKTERITIYDLEAGPGYGDITLENTTLIDSTIYFLNNDTIQIFDEKPDTLIEVYGDDWTLAFDNQPDAMLFPDIGVFFVVKIAPNEFILRQRVVFDSHMLYYFRRTEI